MDDLIVADGMVVSLEYWLTVDEELIDSSGASPLQYLQGFHNIIPGLERELAGMRIGEEKEVLVAPQDAYGEFNPNGFFDLPRTQFPPDFPVEVGHPLRVRTEDGRVLNARISSIKDDVVQIDTNHPLAGKELFFKVKISDLRAATQKEIANGRLGGGCASCDVQGNCTGEC